MKTSLLLIALATVLQLLPGSLVAQTPSDELARLNSLVFPSVSFRGATVAEAIGFFEAKSRTLDPQHAGLTILADGAARASSAKITCDMSDVTLGTAIRFMAILAGLEVSSVEDAVRLRVAANPRAGIAETKPSTRVEARMTILLPSVEFANASLEEALDFIRAKSKDLDPANGNVPVLLMSEGLSPNAKSITLSLKNVSWIKALRYIAELADAELVCLGEGYLFRAKAK
jgi:hypothetical protein